MFDWREAAQKAAHEQGNIHKYKLFRIERMRAYAELRDCRRAYLLNYFGEETSARCNYCDNCEAATRNEGAAAPEHVAESPSTDEPISANEPFPLNCRVTHRRWGKGVVEQYDGDKVVVLFDEAGTRKLSLSAVLDNGLLQRAS
jgi:ATP-dependent DNA helicase RecQ